MSEPSSMPPTVFVLFGAGSDLAWRKLVPALFELHRTGALPEPFALLAVGRAATSDARLRQRLREGVSRFGRQGKPKPERWHAFARNIHHLQGDVKDDRCYRDLAKRLAAFDREWKTATRRVFYLALPPALFAESARRLGRAQLLKERERSSLVVEKPFGHDVASARELNRELTRHAEERQLFRIDHYLGKETVQNILAIRFANPLFEPVWNRHHVDHVAITVAEELGVGQRGAYYERAGALRDMIQNHLLQLFCLVGMETMSSFEADEIRNRKVELLRAVRPIPPDAVHEHAVAGQYGGGWIRGRKVRGYREEPDVAGDSPTETFAALKLWVDNWRWAGVPFYLRTGKRLTRSASEIAIQFRAVPHQVFPPSARLDWRPARLILSIEPEEGIILRLQTKVPGPRFRLRGAGWRFHYRQAFERTPPSAYETLLLDVVQNDPTLFMRFDQVETAWQILQPVLEAWASRPLAPCPNYPAGSWGPAESATLLAADGRTWLPPEQLSP